ncbi:hypothetical protein [Pseudarthrobacter enclensis]|uniref:hypothetical protein n=1 Tax=Pseudarthrobacter enclensis TaxID=993070 RepID=UPI0011469584|nr:hypothetical protein [Pseudarthrobacter enclensis]
MTFVSLGTLTAGVKRASITGRGVIDAYHLDIAGDMSSGGVPNNGGSIWGVMDRQNHNDPTAHVEDIFAGGRFTIRDTRIAFGRTKAYKASWQSHREYPPPPPPIPYNDLTLDTCSNRIMEFGETVTGRIRKLYVPLCYLAPQFPFGTNDVLLEDFTVLYLDGGLRAGHGIRSDAREPQRGAALHRTDKLSVRSADLRPGAAAGLGGHTAGPIPQWDVQRPAAEGEAGRPHGRTRWPPFLRRPATSARRRPSSTATRT